MKIIKENNKKLSPLLMILIQNIFRELQATLLDLEIMIKVDILKCDS